MNYLDCNATTVMPPGVMKEMLRWCNMGNPSAGYATAAASRKMFSEFRDYIRELSSSDYEVIFTSGASESNSTLITSVVDGASAIRSAVASAVNGHSAHIPHIVATEIEHKGVLKTLDRLQRLGRVSVTLIPVTSDGLIDPVAISQAIRPETVLIVCMHANNETGVVNDIGRIGQIAHEHNVPLHCDTVQTFGKYGMPCPFVDSFVVSFHKLHGPPGCGILAARREFIAGYKLEGIIGGNQNDGFRGGTENLPGIGASFAALKHVFKGREEKNRRMATLKKAAIDGFSALLPVRSYRDYYENPEGPDCEIVIFGLGAPTLNTTVLFSVVKKEGAYMCNVKVKQALEKLGIIVSVGSACNTSSEYASHVITALDADIYIRKGTLRLSMCDDTTLDDLKKFFKGFAAALRMQNICLR
jgi:cysteine desulfurase